MVSTVSPQHHQVDLIPAAFSFPPQRSHSNGGASTKSRNVPVSVLSLEPPVDVCDDGSASSSLEVPNIEPGKPRRSGAHAHRRSAAISHDLGDYKLVIPDRPKTMYSLRDTTPNASETSLILSRADSPERRQSPSRKTRVSFVESPPPASAKVEVVQELPPAPVHRVMSSRSFDSSNISSSNGIGDDKRKKRKHKRVRSWAGGLIRFGLSKKEERPKSLSPPQKIEQSAICGVSNAAKPSSSLAGSSPSSSSKGSPVFLPTITIDQAPHSPTNSERRYTWSEPEPLIDLDAALSPFRKSLNLDAEFGSNLYFQHKRSESAPETVIAQGLRGLRNKQMRAVAEELEESDDGPLTSPSSPVRCVEAPSPDSIDPKPVQLSSRYIKYVQPASTSNQKSQSPSSPASLSSYRLQQVQKEGSPPRLRTGFASLNSSVENISPTESKATSMVSLAETVQSPLSRGVEPDSNDLSATVKVVSQISELEQIPSVPTTADDLWDSGKSFGEPGPELRCSIDTLQRAQLARGSYCGSISQQSMMSNSTTASYSTRGAKRRSMPLRLFGWIKRR